MWLEINIPLNGLEDEVLIAYLEEMPFNSFMTEDDVMKAYIESQDFNADSQALLTETLDLFGLNYTVQSMPDVNWNAEWEQNFTPVKIGDLCLIRAPFHEASDGYEHTIVISPKMAFGTGHHETTAGMITAMRNLDFSGRNILDFGSGTGILAIYAVLRGANHCDTIDNEAPSYDNMKENFELNNISNCTAILGTKESIPADAQYDIILANITANVILDAIPTLSQHLVQGGFILFSGFFEENLPAISELAQKHGLTYQTHAVNGRWVIATFQAT